jgi:separase
MAVTQEPAEKLADSVKHDLRTTTSTSPGTLNALRTLLDLELVDSGPHESCPIPSKKPAKPTAKAAARPTAQKPSAARTIAKADFKVHKSSLTPTQALPLDRRRSLATEAFNVTLKQLSRKAKEKNNAGEVQLVKAPRDSSTSPEKVLLSRSPNRKTLTSPDKQVGKNTKAAKPLCSQDATLESTAGCAMAALQCLESLAVESGSAETTEPLVRGGQILLDKLIGLGLTDHAVQQAWRSRNQLCSRLGHSTVSALVKPSLSTAMHFESIPARADLLNSMSTFQLQVLKLGNLLGPTFVDRKLLRFLGFSNPSNPVAICRKAIDSSAMTEDKAGEYLRGFSTILSRLCSAVREPKSSSVAPLEHFQLSVIILKIRCHSWKMLRHRADLEREIWTPVYRALQNYSETCGPGQQEGISQVRQCVTELQRVLDANGEDKQLAPHVSNLLVDVAQRCGSTEDALSILTYELSTHDRPTGLAAVISKCRLATMVLNDATKNTSARLLFCEEALDSLKSSLKGTSSELRDLLLHVARLRKAAVTAALAVEKSIQSAHVQQVDISLQSCSIRLVFSITRFVLRYAGQGRSRDEAKSSEKVTDLQMAVHNTARNTVDSVLSLMRCTHIRSVVLCEDSDAALAECLEIANIVEASNITYADEASKRQGSSTFLRISNIYWGWYLHDKDSSSSLKQLCVLLRKSLEALEFCTAEEKRSGFEAVKYERLASIYQVLQDDETARNALICAIKASISQGALNAAVEIVLKRPSRMAWSNPKLDTHILGSCLRKMYRVSVNLKCPEPSDQAPFFDDETLPAIHRAQILELQLFAAAELQPTAFAQATCKSRAKQVLSLCQQPQYHIYRIRFVRDLLNVAAKHSGFPIHDILDDELIQATCTFQQMSSSTSCFLTPYGPLLCLSVLLQWAFLTSRPSAECVRGLVDSTASLLSQFQSTAELEAAVDDSESLLRQLTAAADYAGMLDLVDIRLAALRAMQQVLRYRTEVDPMRLAGCLVQMGSASARLGQPLDAGRSFAEAEKLLGQIEGNDEIRLTWLLAYSDYLIDLDVYDKGARMIEEAQASYFKLMKQSEHEVRGNNRLKQDSHLSHAALAASNLAFRLGDLRSAIKHARQSVKLTTGLWAALEKLFNGVKEHLESAGIDSSHTNMEETLNTTFSLDQSSLQTVLKGAVFWAHLHTHFQALLHMSTLSAHCGLYPDAVYYVGLASNLSTIVTSDQRQLKCRIKLALLHAKSGQKAQAQSSFNRIRSSELDHLPAFESANASLEMASTALTLNDLARGEQYLAKVDWFISQASPSDTPVSSEQSDSVQLEKQMATLAITEAKTPQRKTSRKAAATRRTTAIPKARQQKPIRPSQKPPIAPNSQVMSPAIARLREAQNTLALQIKLRTGNMSNRLETSDTDSTLDQNYRNGSRQLTEATLLVNQALALFGSDAVHCVLAETALAYPSKYGARGPSSRVSAISATTMSSTAKKISSNPLQKKGNQDIPTEPTPEAMLRKAYGLIASACVANNGRSPSDIVHDVQKLFCRLSMLANAVGLSLSNPPVKVVDDSLKPKDTMLSRERFVLDTDQTTADRSWLRYWPVLTKKPTVILSEGTAEQVPTLVPTFDDLPATWSVVSISLNDAKSELLISRATSGTTPLILRIPLSRSSIDEAEENQFTFEEAKTELVDIINNANLTAHDSRSQGEKVARKVWWNEREALDHRLEALLVNMENIWLGGFRGILSQQSKSDEEIISRFSSSLDAALENHLPSRQKTAGASKHKVRLHAHILELFVALGHPDQNELDDQVTDLLYFVVDILQFEGERNAYDEIDYDAILVEVLDALRSYHEASSVDKRARHTVLILDKELHAFPWEAMPCLLGKSVSRMPSMGMCRDRLEAIRSQNSEADAYAISSNSGAYILNPSSDLASTETTFASAFTKQLPTFTSIISRKPTEPEFESLLRDNSLFLYFGHGSGAQFIRPRRIRQLDRCAVTFLMGCSSGKMNECGVYESNGVPWNYMHAGSMAVVGTLWDVTDLDIDRFAMSAFEEWGLLEGVNEDEKAKKKTEARKRKAGRKLVPKTSEGKGRGQVALDEAVSRAREACILRYLNGAAVVIYGLPVMLE